MKNTLTKEETGIFSKKNDDLEGEGTELLMGAILDCTKFGTQAEGTRLN
jgi:hypothetical protein